eukprot:TRINITY_DN5575_c0_g2_i1.p1 TRINITY_DN5575_c0_g2~~TRINITY_DN5575_c0_g2_i1.p1  ORF type:complete len:601 (+),score=103.52 TRINITY_DN5575_c0_g2_i1:122-1924(+)
MMTGLAKLRDVMKEHHVDAYIIPTNDPHQSEYIAECYERRRFISGFTGSAGTAVVTQGQALLWTDGRYFLQATQELDQNWTLMKDRLPETPSIEQWCAANLSKGQAVAIDPSVVSMATYERYVSVLQPAGIHILNLDHNLVDAVWEGRPPAPTSQIIVQPDKYAGQSGQSKIADVRKAMADLNVGAHVVAALDEVVWLLNVRGADVTYNPVVISYAMVTKSSVYFYVNQAKVTPEVHEHLKANGIEVRPYAQIFADLSELSKTERVWVDPGTSVAVFVAVQESSRVKQTSSITMAKALKNTTELDGARSCHIRDAAALIQYLAWLEQECVSDRVGSLTECTGGDRLDSYRAAQSDFMGLSFSNISGSGPNGAIIHYHPTPQKCSPIDPHAMYLIDSGGQYRDGTTDVTRTVHNGKPTSHEIECYTRVLKGHVALGLVVFPDNKINGYQIDALARGALWEVGLDYAHGTGHGVGSFLNVHEGPHGISFRPNPTSFSAGMLVTNEPGYYEEGKFGIRIENIMAVVPAKPKLAALSGMKFLQFEHITLVPYCSRLIDVSLLENREIDFINRYHMECFDKVAPFLKDDPAALHWLQRETKPIAR